MPPSVGVYIHVPFCTRICPYCDFAVVVARPFEPAVERRYVEALLCELDARAPRFEGRRLASLYFGGGTPSLLQPENVARLCEAVEACFDSASRSASAPASRSAPEVTLEANPATLVRERLPAFRRAGVNRLSIGVQSFDDTQLRALGRAHAARENRRTLRAAREAGFGNLSLDLLFAAPRQTPALLECDLDEVVAFGPEHVSTYELEIKEGTPFGRAAARGQIAPYDEDACACMIERIEARLGATGLVRYELTNYARPGFESRHNTRYWLRDPVLGLGVGAFSFDPAAPGQPFGARPANPRSLATYLSRVEAGAPAAESLDVPDREAAIGEAFFLALRLRKGLGAARFESEFGIRPRALFDAEIDELCDDGLLLEGASGDLALTARGRMLADSVATRFAAPLRTRPEGG